MRLHNNVAPSSAVHPHVTAQPENDAAYFLEYRGYGSCGLSPVLQDDQGEPESDIGSEASLASAPSLSGWILASISGAEPLMEHCSGCCLHPALVSSAHCACASHMLHLSTSRITVMHVQVMLLRPC